nr:type IX secretion system membrane protein PorP/SprF [Paludibacteraceae bacterium]
MMKLQVIKRAVLTLAAVAGIALAVQAQEYPVNNQYYFNYYLINPAVAGAAKCHYFMLTHKQQWMGIDDAPYT